MKLCLKDAQALVSAIFEAAREHYVTVSVVVVDDGGALKAAGRMDGAAPITLEVAWAKASQSVLTGFDGDEIAKMDKERPNNMAAVDALLPKPLVPGLGGLRIRQNGDVVGAVGVSGAKERLDGVLAEHAVKFANEGDPGNL